MNKPQSASIMMAASLLSPLNHHASTSVLSLRKSTNNGNQNMAKTMVNNFSLDTDH